MISEITLALVEAYIQCQRKVYLMLQGEVEGRVHEYSLIMEERATANRIRFEKSHKAGLTDIIGKNNEAQRVVRSNDMIADCDALLKSETGNLTKDKSDQYVPCLVTGTYSVSKEQRPQLAFAAYMANSTEQYQIQSGFIVTQDGQKHRIDLKPLYPKVESIVAELRKMISTGASIPPKLILNSNCPLCVFRDHCHEEAEATDNLSLLARMTQKVIGKYEKKGIFTIKQLSYTFNPRRRRKKSAAVNSVFNIELQALAIRTEKIYLHETPIVSTNPVELFLDIEGIPDQGFQYLIGLIIASPNETKTHSFWANAREDEATIFQDFLTVAESYVDAPIYHYGNYESKVFRQIAKNHGLKMDSIEKRLVNVNTFIYGKVYFPSKSNSLKDLGALVGATWDSSEATGLQSLVWRYRWEDSQEDHFKQTLLRYNQDDCQALKRLLDELRNIGKVAMTRNDVEFVIKPKQLSTETGNVIHTQLQQIIVSAHEEKYERNRLKFRLKCESTVNDQKKSPPQDHISARNIPTTKAETIRVLRKRSSISTRHQTFSASNQKEEHSVVELFFTKSGCRKKILRYEGKVVDSPTYGTSLQFPNYKTGRPRIFGHQFQSWVVNQRIVFRLPLDLISMQVNDLFNEHLNSSSIDSFVQRFAKVYAPTEKELLNQILQSPVVHADETKVDIHGTCQYAWVLTDGIHVIFWLTQTRETTALQELLKDYKGILVSDFYGGYDAFACRQQKCLVHLLRDLNEDLWKNPFSLEYEMFVAEVSHLLVPIFDDVYKYGLKKRHLSKHVKNVSRFYDEAIRVHSKCELIETYRKRFERYSGSLFTFLEGDGIPWNNNMAERAIRHLAIQRKISGHFTKDGAERYLLLLGIAQSCRFQKKSFLRFLLSGEVDVDKFNEKKHLPMNGRSNTLQQQSLIS